MQVIKLAENDYIKYAWVGYTHLFLEPDKISQIFIDFKFVHSVNKILSDTYFKNFYQCFNFDKCRFRISLFIVD